MEYEIIDHGTWVPYKPDVLPDWVAELELIGGNVAFLKRESDGQDFYEYRNTAGRFADGAVVATVLLDPSTGIETVKAVFRDTGMVFPLNQRLIEIRGVAEDIEKVHKLFEWKTYDPATKEMSDPPPPPILFVSAAQAKTALFNAGLLDQVEQIVNNHPYRPMKIFFESANNWLKSDPYIRAIGIELNLLTVDENGKEVDNGFDALFEAANKL